MPGKIGGENKEVQSSNCKINEYEKYNIVNTVDNFVISLFDDRD